VSTAECAPAQRKRLSFLDRFLTLWIGFSKVIASNDWKLISPHYKTFDGNSSTPLIGIFFPEAKA
jgi:hypothetical protein